MKKLYYDNLPEFKEWLDKNHPHYDEYRHNLTIYCDSIKKAKVVTNALDSIRPKG